jgi:3-phenylpropionate/trans-cinnamate dioxygenase ferredoxin component
MSGEWMKVCGSDEVLPGEKLAVFAGDQPLLIVNLDGELYALEDKCTHDDFELSQGQFDAATASIECVLHGARFDVRDGSALCAPAYEPVRRFPARRRDGYVEVQL